MQERPLITNHTMSGEKKNKEETINAHASKRNLIFIILSLFLLTQCNTLSQCHFVLVSDCFFFLFFYDAYITYARVLISHTIIDNKKKATLEHCVRACGKCPKIKIIKSVKLNQNAYQNYCLTR